MDKAPGFDTEEFESWLREQSHEVALAIAARSTLRRVPALFGFLAGHRQPEPLRFALVLSAWRCLALPRAAVLASVQSEVVRRAAGAALRHNFAGVEIARERADPMAFAERAAIEAMEAGSTAAHLVSEADDTMSRAKLLLDSDEEAFRQGDVAAAMSGAGPENLLGLPLWLDGMPDDQRKDWESLKSALLSLNEDWDVWTDWYEARLEGAEANEALEVARVTLPEALWQQGPKAVNGEIRHLIELSQKGGDEAVHARMADLRRQYSGEGGEPAHLDAGSGSFSIEGSEAKFRIERGSERAVLPSVWILQYRPADRVTQWTSEAVPGATIRWKTEKALPKEMRPGDPVIYWRAIDPRNRKDRGGIVGTGHVISTQTEDEDGTLRFPTQVHAFFDQTPIGRDEVIATAGIERRNWRGAVLSLSPNEALRVSGLLRVHGHEALFEEPPKPDPVPLPASETDDTDGHIRVRRDDAEREHDALGRAPLAVSLAWTLHEIWCNEQGLKPFRARRPQADAAGFVAHIDAPWGGGKTSFANLVARTLNPKLDGDAPEFLKSLYSDRADMSGLFIKDTHEREKLIDQAGNYTWADEARQPWIVVPYNAWLNQHVEPPWWSFYETIRKTAFDAIRSEGVSRVWQRGDGNYHTVRENGYTRYLRWVRLWGRELWWRFWTPSMRNAAMAFGLTMLAAFFLNILGLFDLKALTSIFADPPAPKPPQVDRDVAEAVKEVAKGASTGLKALATFLIVLLGGASALQSVFTAFTQTLLPGTPDAAKNYSLGSADPLNRFRKHFACMMEKVSRPVLVVIDDIDRCEPKFIVEMARGLQTILKSPRVVYLLLGDRNWIEQAFAVSHKDMKDIDVGPEHTFGGRFVEKAIQLSFVLPAIGGHKEAYVREVLIGRASQRAQPPAQQVATIAGQNVPQPGETQAAVMAEEPPPIEISGEERQELRKTIRRARTVEGIDAAGAEQLKGRSQNQAFQRAVREEVILGRAAEKEAVETEIGHRLEPLAKYLPGNPRHIKRIINAISMYQNSILLTEEDYGDAEFGGKAWRQLVIGVVLMVGFPKSWSILARHPGWADLLIKKQALPKKGTGTRDAADFATLAGNADFVSLLHETELVEKVDGDPVKTEITAKVVSWLNDVIPVSTG